MVPGRGGERVGIISVQENGGFMSILTEIIGGGLGKLVKDVVGTFKLSPEERQKFELALAENEHEIQMKEYELTVKAMEAEAGVVEAQKAIIVAEMNQTDPYTKRARPTIVYAGLLAIFLVNIILPYVSYFTKAVVPPIALPADFWYVWGGVCGIWIVGRSYERVNGKSNSITGSK
jgi:hypothetical protein